MVELLAALDEQQRAAAECVSGPVLIRAGAGTGKTRTITHRIAHQVASGVVDAESILALTFTTRAAGEMRSRLAGLGVSGVQVRTFHSAAYRQLAFFYPRVFGTALPELMPSKLRTLAIVAETCELPPTSVRDLATEIEWAKVNILAPEQFESAASSRDLPLPAEAIARAYSEYLRLNSALGQLDFEDVLLQMCALLDNYPDIAEAVRAQYRAFTVDEFQDVSPVQFELLRLWLGRRDDVCVVGDPAQTIYGFAGATSDYLTEFAQHFPRVAEFTLSHSYRSTPQLVHEANRVAREIGGVTLVSQTADGPQVKVTAFATDLDEAEGIAAEIAAELRSGLPISEAAVLFRANSQVNLLEQAFRKYGLPVALRGTERFFERPEVRQALLELRATPDEGLPVARAVRDALAPLGWQETAPAGARESWESLATLVALADAHQGSLAEFIADLVARNMREEAPTAAAVTLASIHAAKGLEWDCVWIAGLSEGLLPVAHATTPENLREEQRLFYVALTRARRQLRLSWAQAGRRRPSRFLA